MRIQQPVRDRNLSLWQSAVREALSGRDDLANDLKKKIEYGVSLHALSSAKPESAAAAPADQQVAEAKTMSEGLFKGLKDHQAGDTPDAPFLTNLFRKYSTWDLAGWLQCGWYYMKYYVLAHLPPTYHDWQAHAPADPDYGMIDYKLPNNSRVLLIGDWGTHMADNVALLRQAIKKFEPNVIIHLGDVYYSGTVEECQRNVLDVMDQLMKELHPIKRPAFFAIPGNHDYYSGGGGFYQTIAKVNSGVAGCTQLASYFCLRTEDNRWQFLGMDTGYGDRNPIEQIAPDLQEHEFAWHRHKLDLFPGTTILLSHHQLYSAKEKLNDGVRPYLNEALYSKFKPYFDQTAAWFWGHEHNLIVFEDNLRIAPHDPVLQKGRLVGCSAYEESAPEDPYTIKYDAIRFNTKCPLLKISNYAKAPQQFYNHAFAILDVAPDKIGVSYYEYPSWGESGGPQADPAIQDPIFSETLAPIARAGV